MTASSVEFFPCRVRLMGLPRSAGSAAAAAGTTSAVQQSPPRRPPLEKVQGVSRNLFGSPEPGEINQLFQQESRRHNSYVLQRYNFDMKLLTSSPVTQNGVKSSCDIRLEEQQQPTQQQQLPTLIDREVRQHKQRLQKEECNLNRPNEVTPPNAKIQQFQSCGGVIKIVRRCCGDEVSTPLSSACNLERQKPYARQSLLTETFNLRKSRMCGQGAPVSPPPLSTNRKQRHNYSVANAENLCLEKSSSSDTHRNVQVLKMPKAMQAEMTVIDNTKTTPDFYLDQLEPNAEDGVGADEEDEEQTDDCTSSSAESSPSPSNTTTFSLKLVLSTQDAVATATSSTSREHTHHA